MGQHLFGQRVREILIWVYLLLFTNGAKSHVTALAKYRFWDNTKSAVGRVGEGSFKSDTHPSTQSLLPHGVLIRLDLLMTNQTKQNNVHLNPLSKNQNKYFSCIHSFLRLLICCWYRVHRCELSPPKHTHTHTHTHTFACTHISTCTHARTHTTHARARTHTHLRTHAHRHART